MWDSKTDKTVEMGTSQGLQGLGGGETVQGHPRRSSNSEGAVLSGGCGGNASLHMQHSVTEPPPPTHTHN